MVGGKDAEEEKEETQLLETRTPKVKVLTNVYYLVTRLVTVEGFNGSY